MKISFAAAGASLSLAALLLAGGCGEGGDARGMPEVQAPPAAEALPSFVGRWAAAETACGHAAWSFTSDGLSTPGEVTCRFTQVTRTAEGHDITAICWAGGPPERQRIRLSYDRSARSMRVEGGPFNPVGLVACDDQ